MLVTFAAFCFGAAFLMDRHWVYKVIVILSIVPIALLTNILRITATGLAHIYLKESPAREKVTDFLHDFNGWMMMPVGLTFLLAELWLLTRLIIEKKSTPQPNLGGYTPQPVKSAHIHPTQPIRVRVNAKSSSTGVPLPAKPNPAVPSGRREGFTWKG
jgi:exosortase/archaeosortase family protein